jgi:tetratricopeptide (TPR) repeat protein
LSFNQAGWLLGEIRYCVGQRQSLPGFSLWQRRSYKNLHFSEAASQVKQALHRLHSSPEFRGWRVGDDPAGSRSDEAFLVAAGRYRWAPEAFSHLDLAWAVLQLKCEIRESGSEVTVLFVADDQLGWLFPQAEGHIERAIISAFAACRPKHSTPQPRLPRPHTPRPRMEFLMPTYAPRTPAQKLEWITGFTSVRHCKTLLEADRLPEAFDWSERACRCLPNASFAASVRGFVHLVSARTSAALTDFKRASELDWRNCSAFTGAASAHCVRGDLRQAALAECNAAIGQNCADEWLYELRGSICHEIGNFSQAEDDYSVARRLHAPAARPSLEQRIQLAANECKVEFPDFGAKQWVTPLLLTWRRHVDV